MSNIFGGGSGTSLPTTTKGDLIVYDGSNNVRQAVGANGEVLVADSGTTNGIRWAAAPVVIDFIDPFLLMGA